MRTNLCIDAASATKRAHPTIAAAASTRLDVRRPQVASAAMASAAMAEVTLAQRAGMTTTPPPPRRRPRPSGCTSAERKTRRMKTGTEKSAPRQRLTEMFIRPRRPATLSTRCAVSSASPSSAASVAGYGAAPHGRQTRDRTSQRR